MSFQFQKIIYSILIFGLFAFLFSNSYVNDQGQLIVDGEPYFIFGFFTDSYSSAYADKMNTIDTLHNANFNTAKTSAMNQSWQMESILNHAHTKGIKLIYDGAINNEWKDFHLNIMETYKNNYSVFGWYIVDDSHGVHPDTIKMLYEQAKSIDPNHITTHSMALSCWNDYDKDFIRERIEYCDVLQMQSYPIGKEPIDEVYRDMRKTIETAESYNTPVVIDIQAFSWQLTGHDWGRWPTGTEVDIMTWLAISAGVDGILYYTLNDRTVDPQQSLTTTQPQLWKSLSETANKVNKIIPDILVHQTFITRNPQQNQYYAEWITKDYSTIIAINTSPDDTLYFTIPIMDGYTSLSSIFENNNSTMNIKGRFLKGNIEPMSVQFYRIYSENTSVYKKHKPEVFNLNIYPNPFNNQTNIKYYVEQAQSIDIMIYDLTGKVIKNIENSRLSVGYHMSKWDGTDDNYNTVPSGVYFCRIIIGDEIQIKKILFLK